MDKETIKAGREEVYAAEWELGVSYCGSILGLYTVTCRGALGYSILFLKKRRKEAREQTHPLGD